MTHRKGAYIVSNCCKPVGPNKFKPIFEEEAVALEQRQVQWEHIKAAHADGRICRVYISREYYEECESSCRRFAALKKKHIFNRRITMPICGICKQEKSTSHGRLFHAQNECMHERLFICEECMENVAIQRSYHEMCYECGEHIPFAVLEDVSKDHPYRWSALEEALRAFEKSHTTLFEKLPATTDRDCIYLGSLHPGELKKKREIKEFHKKGLGKNKRTKLSYLE